MNKATILSYGSVNFLSFLKMTLFRKVDFEDRLCTKGLFSQYLTFWLFLPPSKLRIKALDFTVWITLFIYSFDLLLQTNFYLRSGMLPYICSLWTSSHIQMKYLLLKVDRRIDLNTNKIIQTELQRCSEKTETVP